MTTKSLYTGYKYGEKWRIGNKKRKGKDKGQSTEKCLHLGSGNSISSEGNQKFTSVSQDKFTPRAMFQIIVSQRATIKWSISGRLVKEERKLGKQSYPHNFCKFEK